MAVGIAAGGVTGLMPAVGESAADEARPPREARMVAFIDADYARVVGVVTAVCGDRGRAEDAVQEALARAWVRVGRIDALAPWVTRVALNCVRDAGRRHRAEERALARVASRAASDVADRPQADAGDTRVLRTLGGLSRRQREAVVLYYFLDQSVVDVAATLGVSTGSVKTLLHRAREVLRTALEEEGPDRDN